MFWKIESLKIQNLQVNILIHQRLYKESLNKQKQYAKNQLKTLDNIQSTLSTKSFTKNQILQLEIKSKRWKNKEKNQILCIKHVAKRKNLWKHILMKSHSKLKRDRNNKTFCCQKNFVKKKRNINQNHYVSNKQLSHKTSTHNFCKS